MHAVAAAWQLEQIASRDTWESRRVPAAVPMIEQEADLGGFHVEFPGDLARRAKVAKYVRETATRAATGRSGGGSTPVLAFLDQLATAGEHGGVAEIPTAGMSRADLETTRRILVVASERAGMATDGDGLPLVQFSRDLLAGFEAHIGWRPPGGAANRFGDPIRQGAELPERGWTE